MARVRLLRPGFFTNEQLTECSPHARLFFAGLWCWADREGRIEDRPRRLRAEILPYDEVDGEALISELTSKGFLDRYEVNGTRVLQIVNFKKHQNPHPREVPSKLPEPKKQLQGMEEPRLAAADPRLGVEEATPSREKVWKSRADFRTFGLSDSRGEILVPPAAPTAPLFAPEAPKATTPPATAEDGEPTATGRAGKARSPSPPKEKRNPLQRALSDALVAVYAVHRSAKYGFDGAKDGEGLKRLLSWSEDVNEHARRFALALDAPCGNFAYRVDTIAQFASGRIWNHFATDEPRNGLHQSLAATTRSPAKSEDFGNGGFVKVQ